MLLFTPQRPLLCMAISKILTNERFFVLRGGALGFLSCWILSLLLGQSAGEAFEKGALGAAVGGFIFFIFSRVLESILRTIKRKKNKQNEEWVDNERSQ